MNNITKYLLIIIALVILGGATIFLTKKLADTPIEDPVEDLVEEPVVEPVVEPAVEPVVEPVVERTSQVTKDEDLPPAPTPTTTPAKPLIQKPKPIANAPIKRSSPQEDVDDFDDGPTPTNNPAKPLVPATTSAVAQSTVSESRMGWPNGTKWNLRGKTGNDSQRCNDICKNLGYNYFTHNPPPADGGCGCFKSSAKLLQLTMTDHANAKTRRVV